MNHCRNLQEHRLVGTQNICVSTYIPGTCRVPGIQTCLGEYSVFLFFFLSFSFIVSEKVKYGRQ